MSEANPRSSAVGSALRSGRRGRAFESPLLDRNGSRLAAVFGSEGLRVALSKYSILVIQHNHLGGLVIHAGHGGTDRRTDIRGITDDESAAVNEQIFTTDVLVKMNRRG